MAGIQICVSVFSECVPFDQKSGRHPNTYVCVRVCVFSECVPSDQRSGRHPKMCVFSECEPFDQKGGWHPKDLDDRVTVACTHNGSPVGLDQDAPAFTECTATCSSDTYVGMNNMENHYRCDGNSVAGLDNGCRANNSWIVTGRNFIFCSKRALTVYLCMIARIVCWKLSEQWLELRPSCCMLRQFCIVESLFNGSLVFSMVKCLCAFHTELFGSKKRFLLKFSNQPRKEIELKLVESLARD